MKGVIIFLLIVCVLLTFAGVAFAKQMTGDVLAVDPAKGVLTLKSGTVEAGFDCEEGSLIKDVRVGDRVTVKYREEGGKKIVTKVIRKKKVSQK